MGTTGKILWTDITVDDADSLKEFYKEVTGWKSGEVDMGNYSDHLMKDAEGKDIAGICHASGVNKDLPPVWLIYVSVENLEASMGKCRAAGGKIINGPRSMGGYGKMCVIEDPAGAKLALFEEA